MGRLLRRGSIWSVGGYLTGQLIRFGGNLVLWRLLFEEAFGVMALVSVFLIGLEMFSDVGIGPSLIQNDRDDDAFVNTAWTLQVLRGASIWLVACVAAYPLAWLYEEPSLAYLVPVVGLSAVLNGFNSSNVFGEQRRIVLHRITVMEVGSQLTATTVMILWALVHPSVWALAVGAVTGAAAKLTSSHLLLPGRRNRLRWERDAVQALVRFGRWIFVSTLLTFLALQSDRLVFGKLVPMAVLGVYSIAQIYATLPPTLTSHVVQSVIFPALSRHRQAGDDLPAAFRRVRTPVLLGSAFLVSCLLAGGPSLIDFLYDARARDAGWIIQILSIGSWFVVLETVNGAMLLALGHSRAVAAAHGAKILGMGALIPIGYHVGGFPGAVAGFAAADLAKYAVSGWAVSGVGAATWVQDVLFTGGLAAATASGLAVRTALRGLSVHVFLEGLGVLGVLAVFWGLGFLVYRCSPRPVLQGLGREPQPGGEP
ncbi:MAG: oligosaccharide flippase family protein [Myxococcota bacterium]